MMDEGTTAFEEQIMMRTFPRNVSIKKRGGLFLKWPK